MAILDESIDGKRYSLSWDNGFGSEIKIKDVDITKTDTFEEKLKELKRSCDINRIVINGLRISHYNLEQAILLTLSYLSGCKHLPSDKESVVKHLTNVLDRSVDFRESISNVKGL